VGQRDIAIIGASYLQLPLINTAKELGYTTHVFAWAANDVGEMAADHFYPISIVEKENILAKCKEIGVIGICSIASDLATITVNYVADKMHLIGNSMETTMASTNKHLMRNCFEIHGDPSPRSYLVDTNIDFDSLKLDYPVIVKPTDRSGSRGITKLTSSFGLSEAIKLACDQSFEKKALVEEYAEGQEYSVEYCSFKGIHHFLQLTYKFTTGSPHFIETGHLEPAPVDEVTLRRIQKIVSHALDSLGVQYGASHSELKVDKNGQIKLIEIGARMGGDFIGSNLVEQSTGINFIKAVLDIAVGKEPDFEPCITPKAAGVRFVFDKKDIDIFKKLQREHSEYIIQSEINPIGENRVVDSSTRLGYYIMAADNAQDLYPYLPT
jgi:biotin carboxylase